MSDIGRAVAHAFAADGYSLYLAARDPKRLEDDAKDYRLRYGVRVSTHRFDALDLATHVAFVDELPELPTVAVCSVGLLGDHRRAQTDSEYAALIMRSNFEGPANVLNVLAERMERQRSGILVGISSVAGDRSRADNYVYGASKAGFTGFLSGLRQRLSEAGVHVMTVKPGPVYTRMTNDMQLTSLLTAQPEEVARAIKAGCRRKKHVIYVRGVWRWIMFLLRLATEGLFKRMSISRR